jgi:hypothetical protein
MMAVVAIVACLLGAWQLKQRMIHGLYSVPPNSRAFDK